MTDTALLHVQVECPRCIGWVLVRTRQNTLECGCCKGKWKYPTVELEPIKEEDG